MTESLKFGPEWLRNLHSNISHPPPPTEDATITAPRPCLTLAQHRYGREELLALFDPLVQAPTFLSAQVPALYVEKTQPPLALLQMSDEETRLWNQSINSEAILRMTSKAPPILGTGGTGGIRGGGGSLRGSAGLDRGGGSRGCIRGGARGGYHYGRGNYDDVGNEGSGDSVRTANSNIALRGLRHFSRIPNVGPERSWTDRNGVDQHSSSEWNGSATSPRKDYGRGGGFMADNWRRHRGVSDDDDGWRGSSHGKWVRGGGSWRESDKDNSSSDRGGSWVRRGWGESSDQSGPNRLPHRPWDDQDSVLPEWAMENPSESGGSFDASGAFHGGSGFSDEDEEHMGLSKPHPRRLSESNTSSKRPPTGFRRLQPPVPSSVVSSSSPEEESAKNSTIRESEEPHQAVSNSSPSVLQNHLTNDRPRTITDLPPASNDDPQPLPKTTSPISTTTATTTVPGTSAKLTAAGAAADVVPHSRSMDRQKSEDDMERMQEVADDLVAKLMDDEDTKAADPLGHAAKSTPNHDKWFYRDPQGEVQGPFSSSEMLDWFRSGYFTLNLLVRRGCDERYSQLGDLIKMWGRLPFMQGPVMPALKAEIVTNTPNTVVPPPVTVPTTTTTPNLQEPDSILMQQYQFQMQLQQQQQLLLSQQSAAVQAVVMKLLQDGHVTSSVSERAQLASQHIMQYMQANPSPPLDMFAAQKNPVLQLINQMQMNAKGIPPAPANQLDPLQQFIQQIGGLQQRPPPIMDPLLQQKAPVESVWGGATPGPAFAGAPWMPSAPPGQVLPSSLWGTLNGKEMKTEQQVLEEHHRAEEERRVEEQRKLEEGNRKLQEQKQKEEEEERRRKETEEEIRKLRLEEEERQRREAEELERRKKEKEEEERRKKEEERLKKEEEEQKRKEEVEAAELKRKQQEAKKLEESKKKERENAAKKREEEKKRKEAEKEKKKKLEEARKKENEEKKRLEEEEARQKQRQEQQRRQAEALRLLQEQQQRQARAAPWQQSATTHTSALADIQRQERERKEKEQLLLLQTQQQQAAETAVVPATNSNNKSVGLNLKWAEKPVLPAKVKSLSEIQAEEQEQLTKQHEKEQKLQQQQQPTGVPATTTIWGSASQSLNWAQTSNTSSAPWAEPGNNTFWEERTVQPSKQATQKPKQNNVIINSINSIPTTKSGASKTRSKKEEALVMKLFEPRGDEFTQWCTDALGSLKHSVDIPTFVGFLRDIESAYEVKDYVRLYLGDGREAQDFAKQFLERRSRLRKSTQRQQQDDLNIPANALPQSDFQEVKGKGKKTKKNKMMKVDSRILGFNVTAAQDRVNVGDRDYGESV